MKGFIYLHRKMIEWRWYKDTNVKTIFIHFLLKANHKEGFFMGETIKEGELITSLENLVVDTNLTIKQVRNAINKLEKSGEIVRKGTNKFTKISICNYKDYQNYESTKGQTEGKQRTNGGQTKGKQRATNNTDNTVNTENTSEVAQKSNRYDLFLSKFKDYELNLSKEITNLIRHFIKKRWTEEQMDKTANEIHNHFMRMHTSHFDMALRECIDNNGVKIFFEDYSHLRDYELDTLKNDFIMKGVYA